MGSSGFFVLAPLRERIFEPFFSSALKEEGTGLGLSICKQVADAHHGRIYCDETPGGGATFTLRIPEQPQQDSEGE